MHVISQRALSEFWSEHPEAEQPLRRWHGIVKRADWADFASVRRDFAHADAVGAYVVFNVGGNKFRVIADQLSRSQDIHPRRVDASRPGRGIAREHKQPGRRVVQRGWREIAQDHADLAPFENFNHIADV